MEWCGDTDLYSVFDGLGCCLIEDCIVSGYICNMQISIRNIYTFSYPFLKQTVSSEGGISVLMQVFYTKHQSDWPVYHCLRQHFRPVTKYHQH